MRKRKVTTVFIGKEEKEGEKVREKEVEKNGNTSFNSLSSKLERLDSTTNHITSIQENKVLDTCALRSQRDPKEEKKIRRVLVRLSPLPFPHQE